MKTRNNLYPIFLKTTSFRILIVGGGEVAKEKLAFLFKSSPDAKVRVVADFFRKDTLALLKGKDATVITKKYDKTDLEGVLMVIAATNYREVNEQVYRDAKAQSILVNVADTPDLCDFYMGGIVTKGNVKVAISTNGKSPTLAKRLRQLLEDVLPEEIDELVDNLNAYRKTLVDDFEFKVERMNEVTKRLLEKAGDE
jgi:precorrin-2 dehydrogenase/sirohydrochlorin ferrochelatase